MNKYCQFCLAEIPDTAPGCPHCGKIQNYVTPAHQLRVGSILNKKYVVGQAIGEGGFGITYVGKDRTLDMRVAIKEFYPSGLVNRSNTISNTVSTSTDTERRESFISGRDKFLQEARMLAKFSAQNGVVDVRDFFVENNTAYIIMEYLDGITLENYLIKNGVMKDREILRLLTPVMEALIKIHAQGLIHRDISPENIMVNSNSVKLLDFGAAREMTGLASKGLSVVLKPGYAPEEQYRTKGDQGPWSDVYALCATMYRCITGQRPTDSMQRAYEDDLLKPSEMGIAINAQFENVLWKGLSIHKEQRIQSVDRLLVLFNQALGIPTAPDVVNGALSNKKKTVPPTKTVYERTGSRSSQNIAEAPKKNNKKVIIIAVCAAVAVALGVVIAVLLLTGKQEDTTTKAETTQQSTEQTTATPQNLQLAAFGDVEEANDGAQLDMGPFWLTNSDEMQQMRDKHLYSITVNTYVPGSFSILAYDEEIDKDSDPDALYDAAVQADAGAKVIAKVELKSGIQTYYFDGSDSSVTILDKAAINACPATLGFVNKDDTGLPRYNRDMESLGYHSFCFSTESTYPDTTSLAFEIQYYE
ncbi:MAG: serine/threonine protein kinase [Clostridia bacterium]|nr:serine/threonine protein kinase [Clostridia bacterium]